MPKPDHPAPSPRNVHFFDEMFAGKGHIRDHYQSYANWLHAHSSEDMKARREEAIELFHRIGITFSVYGDGTLSERTIPFDTVPRIIPAADWKHLERGLEQRAKALNAFLDDAYHNRSLVSAGLMSHEDIDRHPCYQSMMRQVDLPNNVHAHICGIDIVRNSDGTFYVLEDNLRTPSGVSYMLENRRMMMRLFPELFIQQHIAPIHQYPDYLYETLCEASPNSGGSPTIAVLTPGRFNSAYFEHAYLAQNMGVELVEASDLVVREHKVFMKTTSGLERIDVIYRRIDDEFLDPAVFRSDSVLGVAGLMDAYRRGHVSIVNAVGNGIADDKSMYPLIPALIRFYLAEEPILANVPTYRCQNQEDLAYTLEHLEELVVKEAQGSGGYGMLVGPHASPEEVNQFRKRILAQPSAYIAQPTLALSTCPTYSGDLLSPRHIDLRPFVLMGKTIRIVPGGLTRVALKEGSLVVNSSQGGGTKDTWIAESDFTTYDPDFDKGAVC